MGNIFSRAIMGVEVGNHSVVINKRWYHFWRLAALSYLPAMMFGALFGRRIIYQEDSEEIEIYFL
jgi:branched-subunit amino acid transport protein